MKLHPMLEATMSRLIDESPLRWLRACAMLF